MNQKYTIGEPNFDVVLHGTTRREMHNVNNVTVFIWRINVFKKSLSVPILITTTIFYEVNIPVTIANKYHLS